MFDFINKYQKPRPHTGKAVKSGDWVSDGVIAYKESYLGRLLTDPTLLKKFSPEAYFQAQGQEDMQILDYDGVLMTIEINGVTSDRKLQGSYVRDIVTTLRNNGYPDPTCKITEDRSLIIFYVGSDPVATVAPCVFVEGVVDGIPLRDDIYL